MAQKTLMADGNRRKPPLSSVQQNSLQSDKDSSSVITERSSGTRPLSTATFDGLSVLDDIEDIDDDITTSASDSYVQDDSTSNEGNEEYPRRMARCLDVRGNGERKKFANLVRAGVDVVLTNQTRSIVEEAANDFHAHPLDCSSDRPFSYRFFLSLLYFVPIFTLRTKWMQTNVVLISETLSD